ncbi:MAG: AmmeMemoRadiSam system protein B [Thermodesulfobacteriota bacterium]|nr:AmmeMemoRadiSam system protein B [Thermodesulfobacteriota bacterium]
MMDQENPKIRHDIQLIPVQSDGQTVIAVQDDLGLVQAGIALNAGFYKVLTLMDGTRSKREIQFEMTRLQRGILVTIEELENLLSQLESLFLLDNESYRKARDVIIETFTHQKVRPCSMAGRSYPNTPRELRAQLDLAFQDVPTDVPSGRVTTIVAPHIGLEIGQNVYARSYRFLSQAKPRCFILLGVGHQIVDDFFCITSKDFETPLGLIKTNDDLVRSLQEAGESIISKNDFYHRGEHSLEFQVIFLQHLFGELPFTIVPILCGSIKGAKNLCTLDEYREKAGPVITILQQYIRESGKETVVVAGVDFSHIGMKFGHNVPAYHMAAQAEEHDKKLIHFLCEHDAEGFWSESERVRFRYNVCGFSALACMLEIMVPSKGKLLDYHMWHEIPTQSAVGFAALAFTESTQYNNYSVTE